MLRIAPQDEAVGIRNLNPHPEEDRRSVSKDEARTFHKRLSQ
jgi:hypothetical protein